MRIESSCSWVQINSCHEGDQLKSNNCDQLISMRVISVAAIVTSFCTLSNSVANSGDDFI